MYETKLGLPGGRLVDWRTCDRGKIQSQKYRGDGRGRSGNEEVGGGWGRVYLLVGPTTVEPQGPTPPKSRAPVFHVMQLLITHQTDLFLDSLVNR